VALRFDTSEAVDKQLRLLRAMDTNYCIELHIASACGVDQMAFLDEFHGHVAQLGIKSGFAVAAATNRKDRFASVATSRPIRQS
jgi:hypothetical protein